MINYTLGDWLDTWYNTYKAPNLRNESLRNIRMVIRLHIPQSLKDCLLCNLSVDSLERAIIAVQAPRMKQYTYQVLNGALERAKRLGYLEENYMKLIDFYKHRQKRGSALTKNERIAFAKVISGSKYELLYNFYLWTGCRRSEALEVRWNDIDIGNNTIHIRGTKSEASDRVLPIFAPLQDILSKIPLLPSGKLFECTPDHASKQFKKYCPNHKLHDLRHTFATRCLESGISIRVVQQWLGHESVATTSKIYTHVLDDFQRSEALKLKVEMYA